MKAIVVYPSSPKKLSLLDIPKPVPAKGELLVKILKVGICRTDIEIYDGLYGEPPLGSDFLVMGHEALGQLADGSLVVPMVRKSCEKCPNCLGGAPDMCSTGDFLERGIKGLHGMLCEYIAEKPEYLVPVPAKLEPFAVLLEPMSVVAKGIRHLNKIQSRMVWGPKRALVLGAGPIGLLATMVFRVLGYETFTVARKNGPSYKSSLVEECGAVYIATEKTPVSSIGDIYGKVDIVFEATGNASVAFNAISAVAVNGVVCLTSVTGGDSTCMVDVDRLNREIVLGNKVIFGTVNANRQDFLDGLVYLEQINGQFPGLLSKIFTSNREMEECSAAFSSHSSEVKALVNVAKMVGV